MRTTTGRKIGSQPQTGKKDTPQDGDEGVEGTTSRVNPSQTIRKLTQEKEACNKRKYNIEDPIITLT